MVLVCAPRERTDLLFKETIHGLLNVKGAIIPHVHPHKFDP